MPFGKTRQNNINMHLIPDRCVRLTESAMQEGPGWMKPALECKKQEGRGGPGACFAKRVRPMCQGKVVLCGDAALSVVSA